MLPITSVKRELEKIYEQVKRYNLTEAEEIMHWVNRAAESTNRLSLEEIIQIDQIFMKFSKDI
jgi:hypothetical protein